MNIENAKQEFLNFVSEYDQNHPKIIYKREHSLRVMKEAEELAKALNLNKEEIKVASLIGLLHDIGRFEQIKIYDTYKDFLSIDHGDLGAEILQKNNYLRKYIDDDKYDSVILKAIKNHNKFAIEDGLSEKELLFAKLIRDADKLDIFYEGAEYFWSTEEERQEVENSNISPEVLEAYNNKMIIDRKICKTAADKVISFLAFMHDINFEYSRNKIKNEKYVEKILGKFNHWGRTFLIEN